MFCLPAGGGIAACLSLNPVLGQQLFPFCFTLEMSMCGDDHW